MQLEQECVWEPPRSVYIEGLQVRRMIIMIHNQEYGCDVFATHEVLAMHQMTITMLFLQFDMSS